MLQYVVKGVVVVRWIYAILLNNFLNYNSVQYLTSRPYNGGRRRYEL